MSDNDKSGSSFWSAFDNILRTRPTSAHLDTVVKLDKKLESNNKSVEDSGSSEEIYKRLNVFFISIKFYF